MGSRRRSHPSRPEDLAVPSHARIEQREDVRMVQPCGDRDLAKETLPGEGAREVHRRNPARPEFTLIAALPPLAPCAVP